MMGETLREASAAQKPGSRTTAERGTEAAGAGVPVGAARTGATGDVETAFALPLP